MQENNPEKLDFFYLAYKSKNQCSENTHQINLLLHEDHYYLVSNLSKLLASTNKKGYLSSSIYCMTCFSQFPSVQRRDIHMTFCKDTEHTIPSFPHTKLEFTKYEMLLQASTIVFYDIENVLLLHARLAGQGRVAVSAQ